MSVRGSTQDFFHWDLTWLKRKRHSIGATCMWLSIMFLVMSIALRYTAPGFLFVWFSLILLLASGYFLDIFREIAKEAVS